MTTFLDGPAKGQTLMLDRAPVFLRVVRDDKHSLSPKWDALNHPEDRASPGETPFAYFLPGKPGSMHLNMGRKGGGWYKVAEYKLCDPQPPDETMRVQSYWVAWCLKQTPPEWFMNASLKTDSQS